MTFGTPARGSAVTSAVFGGSNLRSRKSGVIVFTVKYWVVTSDSRTAFVKTYRSRAPIFLTKAKLGAVSKACARLPGANIDLPGKAQLMSWRTKMNGVSRAVTKA